MLRCVVVSGVVRSDPDPQKGYIHIRVCRRRRFEPVIHQADARICGRGHRAFLLYDAAEGRGEWNTLWFYALIWNPRFISLLHRSSSMRRSAAASVDSQITPVIQIASSQSGRSGSTSGWAFSQIVRSRRTRN